ncbi:MAG TPA: YdeI/OmpD-associated family protein, partial [Terriglobales bacterium]|nr:YdeI/OmpD-associated family protein [Terriglobales bacterium]
LPPLIQAALARNPKAREGWQRMTPGQRRAQLLAIFYYRNPESRARRITKAVEVMVEYAEKGEAKARRE